jgi:cell division protease FtsH
MPDDDLSARAFGPAFKGFLEQAANGVPAEEPIFARRIREHLGADPTTLEIVGQTLEVTERPNLQLALDSYLEEDGRSAERLGFVAESFVAMSLTMLIARGKTGLWGGGSVGEGPVGYAHVDVGEGKLLACIDSALLLLTTESGPRVLLVSKDPQQTRGGNIELQAMAPEREPAERLLADLRVEMRRRNVYRARAISLHQEPYRPVTIRFRELPKIGREQIILPEGVLERVEAQTIVFGRHAVRLREAGRHLRRGLLLHGPPGTGKTLTAMYLAGQLEERTAILLTGAGLGLIERSVALARILQPSLVVLEDVDLVAEDRARQTTGCNTILFELLNQMDGLAEDADVIFLLTSNRPDLLEPALASRPGRVDQAIEIPLPDETCRRRLFELYADGLQLDGVDFDRLVERTRGVSGAFIRELLRKAALFAADESEGAIVVRGPHLDSALHELVVEGGQLTKSFLGFAPPPAA